MPQTQGNLNCYVEGRGLNIEKQLAVNRCFGLSGVCELQVAKQPNPSWTARRCQQIHLV